MDLTITEFCRENKFGITTFYKLRKQGKAPPTYRITSGMQRIRRVDADAWKLAHYRAAGLPGVLPPPPPIAA
jgi:hypothetical protein